MVASGRKCTSRPAIRPTQSFSANFYRGTKTKVGHSLRGTHCKGNWSLPESKLHINYLELKAVFLALKEFQDLCSNKIVFVATDNTTRVANRNREIDMRSGSTCALLWRILTCCSRKQVTLKARHIPGQLNVVADKLSMQCQTIQIECPLLPEVFQLICTRWHRPQIDLFAHQRGSSRSVNEAKWTIFTKWCFSNQVDFRAPPRKSITDFLLYLFQDRKLQPSNINVYRSAIADKLGNLPIYVSKDENLNHLLDSFHRERPKGQRGILSWNLSLVLHQLTKAPFEPIK